MLQFLSERVDPLLVTLVLHTWKLSSQYASVKELEVVKFLNILDWNWWIIGAPIIGLFSGAASHHYGGQYMHSILELENKSLFKVLLNDNFGLDQ